jgi:RimJ/RimL family protein N-acetyltransferase
MVFRPFESTDLDDLARISADPDASRYVGDGRPLSRQETRRWIENSRRNVERFGYGTGAVVHDEQGVLMGWAGIARPEGEPEEVIYGFDRPWWGQGYGTELLEGLCRWAFDRLGLEELRATVHPDNTASVTLLTRRGFRLVDPCYQGDPDSALFILRRAHPPNLGSES